MRDAGEGESNVVRPTVLYFWHLNNVELLRSSAVIKCRFSTNVNLLRRFAIATLNSVGVECL